jgi:hypothetical protein
MPHNGNIGQINTGYGDYAGRGYEFINAMKLASPVTESGGTQAKIAPNLYSANGYPISTATHGSYRQIWIPNPHSGAGSRPGDYKIRWTGRHSLQVGGSSFGLATDYEGTFTPSGDDAGSGAYSLNVTYGNIDEGNPPTSLEIFHEDDEVAFDAGGIFVPRFLEEMEKFGVIRFLTAKFANGNMVSKWEQETPESFISYGGVHCPPGYYKGVTTNTGDAYSLAATGFALSDKIAVVGKWNATASAGAGVTLNVNGTGAIAVKGHNTSNLDNTVRPTANSYFTAVYDESLNIWMIQSGAAQSGGAGFRTGWPPIVALKLCNEVGAHPWFSAYHLTLDPPTDYMTELATLCKTYAEANATWMRPWFEGPNEEWNTEPDFEQTRYGWAKAKARSGWGAADFDTHNHYGRVLSLMGAEVAAVYNDPSKYNIVCGVQMVTAADTESNGLRLAGKHVTVDGGDPASDYVTHIAPAIYTGLNYGYQAEIDYAWDMSLLDESLWQAFADNLVENCPSRDGRQLRNFLANWKTFCTTHGKTLASYEGAHGLDYPAGSWRPPITAISKAAQAVVTLNVFSADVGYIYPPIGSNAQVVGGDMTQIIGSHEVISRDTVAHTVTLDVNSTAFTTYTTGGSLNFDFDGTRRYNLRYRFRFAPALEDMIQRVFSQYMLYGGVYPSTFDLQGLSNINGAGAWAKIEGGLYGEVTPEYDGITAFSQAPNTGAKLTKLRLTSS